MARALQLAFGAGVLAILAAERARPLRPRGVDRTRLVTNAALGAGCGVVIAALVSPLAARTAQRNALRPRGVAALVPAPLGQAAAFLALDYAMYLWHVATHRVPALWRLHRVHHADDKLDASTALRFHAADMLVSLPVRWLQVRMSGAGPRTHAAWSAFFSLSVLFHHSNWRLGPGWERRLSAVLTTPAMHGLHHSIVPAHQNSNWSSGISWWDHLHGTWARVPDHSTLRMGAPGAEPGGVRAMLRLPFAPVAREQQRARESGDGGSVPDL